MKLVDTHCHLDNEKFNEDREDIIKRIDEELEFCVNIGYDLESSEKTVEYTKKYRNIYGVVGVHPVDITGYNDEIENKIEELAKNKKVVAIGEIGLDYHWMTEPKETQQDGFRKQIKLAEKLDLPIVVHSRDAMEDTIKILQEFPNVKGVIHCYPGSLESAEILVKNYYLGIGGTLTFKNSKKLVNVVKNVPLEKLVIETDCPYLTPEPFRGKRNEPLYVQYVAEKIAELKEIPLERVIEVTTNNAKKLYGIA